MPSTTNRCSWVSFADAAEREQRGVAVGDGGARDRAGLDDGAGAAHEQLGAGADEALARVDERARLAGDEPAHDLAARRTVCRPRRAPRARARPSRGRRPRSRRARARRRRAPVAAGARRRHGEAGRRRCRGVDVAAGRTDLGDPGAAVERAEHAGRDHQLAVGVGIEGQRADRDRTGPGQPDRVVDGDRGEVGAGVGGCEACRDARRDDPGAVVQPREAAGIEAVERIGRRVDLAGDRVQPGRARWWWSRACPREQQHGPAGERRCGGRRGSRRGRGGRRARVPAGR